MPQPRTPAQESLQAVLRRHTAEGALYERLDGGRVRCFACGHRCAIPDGHEGICKVRFNRGGTLLVPHGYVAGLQVDPIEKKPFFHVLPGASALSFGMLGCDFHCAYCQNWLTSQTLRDSAALAPAQPADSEQIVALARARQAPVVVSTYNEPLITSEWACEIFRLARREGLVCGYVSNGNGTPEVLEYLRPTVDLFKVDLKGFRPERYRELGGRLQVVLDTIASLHRMGFWIEIVTLLVAGFNDSDEELNDLASFIVSVSPDIPWHVTAFHPDYRMTGAPATTARELVRAALIGRTAGLRYVYAGNLPGLVGDLENTRCPECRELLIERAGFRVLRYGVTGDGECPACRQKIAGVWRAGWKVPQEDGAGRTGLPPRLVRVEAPPAHGPGADPP